jgi:ATP-dependent Lon protease
VPLRFFSVGYTHLMNLPAVIPVMLLEQCNAFPHGLLPLYIFEPRYRAMLRHALEHDRLLCIGHLASPPDPDAAETDDRIDEYLVLQGAQRVRFLAWDQYEPFRIARIEPVPTVCANPAKAVRKGKLLLDRVLTLISPATPNGPQLISQLQKLSDPAHLTDFVAGNLIHSASARQPLLGMTEVEDRLDFLLHLVPEPGSNPAKA